jgi:hypothetical protein
MDLFGRNEGFVGCEPILHQLLERIPPSANKDDYQHTVIEGLGGVSKAQIALRLPIGSATSIPTATSSGF